MSTRRLAKTYVAVIRDPALNHIERSTGSRKRETFEAAKAIAVRRSSIGTTVELRKETDTGGIIDRVKLVREGRRVWVSDFET